MSLASPDFGVQFAMLSVLRQVHHVVLALAIAGWVCVDTATGSLMSVAHLDKCVSAARDKSPERSKSMPLLQDPLACDEGSLAATVESPATANGSGSFAIMPAIWRLPTDNSFRPLSVCNKCFIPDSPRDGPVKPPKTVR